MRQIPQALLDHLAGDEWTVATCWKFERADGRTLGFTSHDCALHFDGQNYEPGLGLHESLTEVSEGLAVGSQEVTGAISSHALDETDLRAGLWDGARITVYFVNWQAPESQQTVLMRAVLGEVRRDGLAFKAELRTLLDLFADEKGRVYARQCSAELGDTACRVDLDQPAFSATATLVDMPEPQKLEVSGLAAYDAGWFSGGVVRFDDGSPLGQRFTVVRDEKHGSATHLTVTRPVAGLMRVGAVMTVAAGCDKSFETCQRKFSNAANFQGFPHMPGNDFVLWGPRRNTGENTGGALS
ncbi:DUF2163 domain-containing protein [Pseudovibrio exalbescens]|uniref:DUF2163 domain-containing protein n=1 Tax=Pseudovibrio exalbescens TaxID=197461 RepID=UPI000C9BB72A|nr:DUF2163 domain-containing protein [Pseudovibrio exalbescens]